MKKGYSKSGTTVRPRREIFHIGLAVVFLIALQGVLSVWKAGRAAKGRARYRIMIVLWYGEKAGQDQHPGERWIMTDRELKKLGRAELLELLLEESRENELLREQLKSMEKQLESRTIRIEQAGSIAEAALALNGVFQAAQQAADQYLENVRRLAGEQRE